MTKLNGITTGEIVMIRPITKDDFIDYMAMATEFYHSDAVLHPIPESHIEQTFKEVTTLSLYTEGYLFEYHGKAAGYSLLAKTYSQEAGGMVLWIEELYVRPEYRNKGLGSAFFGFLENKAKNQVVRIRLEVDEDNEKAMALYERMGYRPLHYRQMYKGK